MVIFRYFFAASISKPRMVILLFLSFLSPPPTPAKFRFFSLTCSLSSRMPNVPIFFLYHHCLTSVQLISLLYRVGSLVTFLLGCAGYVSPVVRYIHVKVLPGKTSKSSIVLGIGGHPFCQTFPREDQRKSFYI
jgi:hypothetical protein